jgi:hypothetical protein
MRELERVDEHPICLLHKCPGYPCRIFDEVKDKPVVCREPGFWERHTK